MRFVCFLGVLGLVVSALCLPAQEPNPPKKYAFLAQGNRPAVAKKKSFTNSIGMKLVRIPKGKFTMGSPKTEKDRSDSEGPQHEVTISKDFYLGIHEVTQAEYQKVMGKNPSYFNGKNDNKAKGMETSRFPVEQVSWEDAVAFCKKLTALEKQKNPGSKLVYRLPSEAEWEYSCRGGRVNYQVFHFGNSLSSTQANFHGAYPYGGAAKGPYLQRTTSVGSYKPNAFGLYDMHGNVWEWCQDWYDSKAYERGACTDPIVTKKGSFRVLRGGCWSFIARSCRSAFRSRNVPSFQYGYLGFRVAASSVK